MTAARAIRISMVWFARLLGIAAFAWAALIAAWYVGTFLWENPDARGVPVVGAIGLAIGLLAVVGVFRSATGTWVALVLFTMLIFAPGLLGIPYFVSALLVLMAAVLQSLFERRPNRLCQRAAQAFARGDLPLALVLVNRSLLRDPKYSPGVSLRSDILRRIGLVPEAIGNAQVTNGGAA